MLYIVRQDFDYFSSEDPAGIFWWRSKVDQAMLLDEEKANDIAKRCKEMWPAREYRVQPILPDDVVTTEAGNLFAKRVESFLSIKPIPLGTPTMSKPTSMEASNENDRQTVVRNLLYAIGEDPDREGLRETPARVVRSWSELFSGYGQDPLQVMKSFESDGYDQIVAVRRLEFFSTCEHHLLPFFGEASIAYIPKDRVLGVSKLARLLEIYSRRLQIQERLTQQIVDALTEGLAPLGAACIIEAKHFCMVCRGVQKQNSTMVTSALSGAFLHDPGAKAELFSILGRP